MSRTLHNSLTGCVIARNSSATLDACLASLEPICDELVVVDTGSTDGTYELAEERGATTIRVEWEGFSSARNTALAACRTSWVIFLDSDEVIHASRSDLLDATAAAHQGYVVIVRNYVSPSRCSMSEMPIELDLSGRPFFRSRAVRIFRRLRETKFSGTVHESVEESIFAAGGTIGKLNDRDLWIDHSGYLGGGRDEMYIRLAAEAARRGNCDWQAMRTLGLSLVRKDANLAEALLLHCDEAWPNDELVLYGMAVLSIRRGDLNKACEVLSRSEAIGEVLPLTLATHCEVLFGLGRISEAIAALNQLREFYPRLLWGRKRAKEISDLIGRTDVESLEARTANRAQS